VWRTSLLPMRFPGPDEDEMKLNKITAARVEVPAGRSEVIVFDDDIPGFGVRVREGGSRNWIFQYRVGHKQRRISFGSASTVTAQEARTRAIVLHARVKLGEDPAGQKIENQVRASETFDRVLRSYLAYKKSALRPRSYEGVERHLEIHAKRLHGLQMAAVDRRDVAALLTELAASSGPTAANHVRASLSAFFAWAIKEGLAETNPTIATNRAIANGPRDRVLDDGELREIWQALPDNGYGSIVKLLVLTGCRREEIGGLRWREVDLDRALITLPAERTKNGKEHEVPLSPAALAVLKERKATAGIREYVFGRGADGFQGWSNSKDLLDKHLAATGKELRNWRLHDLRRLLSTRMHELGIAPHIVEAVLNHTSGHKAGVAGVYNHARYTREKATALTRWADYVLAVIEGRPVTDTVVQLRA
jgi:integrase